MPRSNRPAGAPEPGARYPDVRIRLHSDNPLALVAAVRQELRSAGVAPAEVRDFTDQALSTGVNRDLVRQVVEEWVGGVGVSGSSQR